MPAQSASLGLRLGGTTVAPGEACTVSMPLPGRRGDAAASDAVPALVIAGQQPGTRVVILAGVRGFEVQAARIVTEIENLLLPADVSGDIVLIPVLRPGGRFAAAGRPVKRAMEWHFPGDPTGTRAARDAFAVLSEPVAGASLVLTVSEADPGRIAALTVKADLDDPRARRLARLSGATAVVHAPRRSAVGQAPPCRPSVREAVVHLELVVPPFVPEGPVASEDDLRAAAAAVVGRVLHFAGAWNGAPAWLARDRGPTSVCRLWTTILAPAGGFLDVPATPGALVAKGDVLVRISPPLARNAATILAPHAGIVLEAPARAGTRRGAKLFLLGRLAQPRADGGKRDVAATRSRQPPPHEAAGGAVATPLRLGWVERVTLPSLGIRLLAKIDTGARTSALHVTRMKVVGTTAGLHHRPILEVTVPHSSKRPHVPRVVRVHVRDYIQVKATSGRTERRPVIETRLRLGPVERKIRVTLTDRGDMLFPMLIGRTALGAGVVVDPSRRRLLRDEGAGAATPEETRES